MRHILRLLLVLLLSCCPSGCGSNTSADSDLPAGVRKNENRNMGVGATKKGKPYLIDGKPKAP